MRKTPQLEAIRTPYDRQSDQTVAIKFVPAEVIWRCYTTLRYNCYRTGVLDSGTIPDVVAFS